MWKTELYFPCSSVLILCSLSRLQPLTIFQRSLTTMQIQIQGLLQFAVPLFPSAEVSQTPSHDCYP